MEKTNPWAALWPHMKSSSGILNVTDSIDCLTLVDISGLEMLPLIERISNPGKYPQYLWLFEDIIDDLRRQLVFQDHLVSHVRRWKEEISSRLGKDVISKHDYKLLLYSQSRGRFVSPSLSVLRPYTITPTTIFIPHHNE